MKRFVPVIICCYLFNLLLPLSLRANVLPISETNVTGAAADDYYSSRPKLSVISNNKIGQTLVTSAELSSTAALSGLAAGAAGIAGIAYYERTGKEPVYAALSAVASAADALFVPAYQAFKANFVSPESFPATAAQYVGLEGSVGAKIGNLVKFVNSSAEGAYSALKAAIAAHSTPEAYQSPYPAGETSTFSDGKNYILTFANYSTGMDPQWCRDQLPIYPHIKFATGGCWISGPQATCFDGTLYGTWMYRVWFYNITETTNPATYTPTPASVDYVGLSNDLKNPSPALSTDIKDAIKNLPSDQKITSADPAPSSIPASNPSPITNNQVQNFFATNTSNVYNKTLETITNNETSTTTSVTNEVAKGAAEAAKAQEEEVTKETEETFRPISDTAFAEPYNPGEFDIPARFTTFLNNVKSSGLFSFSNNFFNSLPSGGSPIFEIEGGIFGSHSIDLSETMSGGLAVVKTVLLALFGFLSIRAVIMKR